ncbi:hypothetical protein QAO71_17795 (plasmid) [Halopseudomonas sp. SMJS2]|uniref:hypothetical protein n=1 Tax=Halopseudomonas sp. SMJS2 TaxID=3041098 RepID=UPI002452B183|nr:hypothetical protein [Halopseudomonas sp. SMJS2]WGK63395.1 hypothetical protein QAO71_17795 [Halopseudomonas sp. SMJS2]
MMRISCITFGIALIAGCASNQPTWVTDRPAALCTEGIEVQCLSELVNALIDGRQDLGPYLQHRLVALDAAGMIRLKPQVREQWTTSDEPGVQQQLQAFTEAGQNLRLMIDGHSNRALAASLRIEHQPASDFAVLNIINHTAQQLDSDELGQALNTLSIRNTKGYHKALQGRLNGLLITGDLERAKALRQYLLANAEGPGKHFDLVVEIAAAYALSGLPGDSRQIAGEAFRVSSSLATNDNRRLIGIALNASSGVYPPEQDFHFFTDDSKRLDAYLLVSDLAQRNGKPDLALRALNDGVRLIQKSGFTGSRPEAILNIALIASGII